MKKSDGTYEFEVLWLVGGSQVAQQVSEFVVGPSTSPTSMYPYTATGLIEVNVSIRDLSNIIVDSQRPYFQSRGNNGPTSIYQLFSFYINVYSGADTSGCIPATYNGNSYCVLCATGKSCQDPSGFTATPLTSLTETTASLEGLQLWMIAVGIVMVIVGIGVFFLVWKLMIAHQESSPVEILPLTKNILIVRGALMGVQLTLIVVATFTIFYCVYQYYQLTVFGQSIILGVISCAVVVWFASYVGLFAAYYKSRSALFINFILLLLLFGCLFLFSILLIYVMTNVTNSGVLDQLSSEWNDAVLNRPSSVCTLQGVLGCSGFNYSCAGFVATSPQGSSACPAYCSYNEYSNPCLPLAQSFVQQHFGQASAGGWVLTALLLAGLILSVALGCAIKNRRNVVHRERRVRHATGQNILLPEEVEMLRKEFNKIDKDGSGDISREEFSMFYNAVMGTDLSPRELEEYFDKLDADGNGNLSFEEFLKVYVPHREPKRKSFVKPKSFIVIPSDEDESVSQEPTPRIVTPRQTAERSKAYQSTTQHVDNFAFQQSLGGKNKPLQASYAESNRSSLPPVTKTNNLMAGSYQESLQSNQGVRTAPPPALSASQQRGRGTLSTSTRSDQVFPSPQRPGGRNRDEMYNLDDMNLNIDLDNDFM